MIYNINEDKTLLNIEKPMEDHHLLEFHFHLGNRSPILLSATNKKSPAFIARDFYLSGNKKTRPT